jgi:hypothetical protein
VILDGDVVVEDFTTNTRSPFLGCGIGYVRMLKDGVCIGQNFSAALLPNPLRPGRYARHLRAQNSSRP